MPGKTVKSFLIRPMREDEYLLLEEFLYEAIFIPEGTPAPPRSIVQEPELQVYVSDFGKREGDTALAAQSDGKIAGAIWARIMDDYGHVDDKTPSLAMSVHEPYRGCGIGTALLREILSVLAAKGYERTSLSAQKANYAAKMYRKAGFEIVRENEEEYIMVCRLAGIRPAEHERVQTSNSGHPLDNLQSICMNDSDSL